MHERINLNNMLLSAIFSALGILVPVLFHLVGLGSMFLPMYLPLAVGAYLLSGRNALMLGVFTPLMSAFITGMPPIYPPVAFMMSIQLGTFCLLISFFQHQLKLPVLVTLLIAMAVDRAILVAAYYLIAPLFSINVGIASAYDIIKSFPGIILMCLIVPVAVPRFIRLIDRNSLRPYEHKNEKENGTHGS